MPSQQEIADQLQFLQTSRAKLGIYLGQLRLQGQAFVQPSVLLGIAEERAAIARFKQILRDWRVAVDDHPDDDGPGPGINPNDMQVLLRALEQRKSAGDDTLYQALRRLNYSAQTAAFMRSVGARSVAAYLIDGQRKYGQRWLLNLLVRRYEQSIQSISIDLRRLGRGKSIADLCQEIARKAGVAASTPEQLAAVLCRWWETQHTILIFHSVDLVGEAYLREILTSFWAPIASLACQPDGHNRTTKLLLFFVDNQGVAAGWNLPFAQGPADDPARPVRLPAIARFSDAVLNDWIEASLLDLPEDFPARTDVQTILEHTDNGIPETVLEEICAICDYDWNEGASRWLKH